MVIFDDREAASFSAHMAGYGIETAISRLEFGDACFSGNGPNGEVMVGVEHKRLDIGSQDLVASLLDDRLIGHQIKGMRSAYDQVVLLVEGNWRCGGTGEIEALGRSGWEPLFRRRKGISYRQIDGFLASLEYSGVAVWRAQDERQSAAILASRYQWWSKAWKDHRSLGAIYAPGPETARSGGKPRVWTEPPTLAMRIAAQIPGLDRRAWEVGKRFGTATAMVNASREDWREALTIKARKSKTVEEVYQALRSEK